MSKDVTPHMLPPPPPLLPQGSLSFGGGGWDRGVFQSAGCSSEHQNRQFANADFRINLAIPFS